MKNKEHSKSYIKFDSLCQRLGENPVIRCNEYIPGAVLRGDMKPKMPDDMMDEEDMSIHTFILSSPGTKRDGNEIDQSGWMTKNFRNNPVVLWGHNKSMLPIGRSNWEKLVAVKKGESLVGNCKLDVTDGTDEHSMMINKVNRYLNDGLLNTVSVGWIPLEYEYKRDKDGYYTGILFKKNDLLEYSVVPCPADPSALKQEADFFRSMGDVREALEGENVYIIGQADSQETGSRKVIVDLGSLPATETIVIKEPETATTEVEADSRVAIPFRSYTVVTKDRKWSASEAKKRVAEWAAGSNGEINYTNYRLAFLYENSADDKLTQSDYKGPHHDVVDGDLVTVPRGVMAAAQRIQQNAFDVTIKELQGMKEHVAKHYAEWDEKAPWDRSIGKMYEEVQRAIAACSDDEELDYLRESAKSLAERIYGNDRLPEAWESSYEAEFGSGDYRKVADAVDSVIGVFVGDPDDKAEVSTELTRKIVSILYYREAALKLVSDLYQATGIKSPEELLTRCTEALGVKAETGEKEQEIDLSDAIARLSKITSRENKEIIIDNSEKNENKSLTLIDEIRNLAKEIVNGSPVSG